MNELARAWLRNIALGLPLLMGSGCGSGGCVSDPGTDVFSLGPDAGAGSCMDLCLRRDPGNDVTSCAFVTADGGRAVSCTHTIFCGGGRRPIDFRAPSLAAHSACGAWLSEVAALEAASVDAFGHLAIELRAHGAPDPLARAALRSAKDEVRHARSISTLARALGESPQLAVCAAQPVRPLAEFAVDNAIEGCVRETLGALVASHQAQAAGDAVVRSVFARIARDEARHALLSFAILDWSAGRLGSRGRARLDDARRGELGAMASSVEREAPAPVRAWLGLPSATRMQSLITALA